MVFLWLFFVGQNGGMPRLEKEQYISHGDLITALIAGSLTQKTGK
jgi:hypothetical protein